MESRIEALKNSTENWEPLRSYFNPEQAFRRNNFINCSYDPSDDGNNENQFFANQLDVGPSSTCFPTSVNNCLARTSFDRDTPFGTTAADVGTGCFPETSVLDDPNIVSAGFGGNAGGNWLQKKYNLKAYRGRKVLVRFHISPFGLALVMVTERGLAGLAFADAGREREALADMTARWPNAARPGSSSHSRTPAGRSVSAMKARGRSQPNCGPDSRSGKRIPTIPEPGRTAHGYCGSHWRTRAPKSSTDTEPLYRERCSPAVTRQVPGCSAPKFGARCRNEAPSRYCRFPDTDPSASSAD